MTRKISAFGVMTGDTVDIANDIIPINDVSVATNLQNKNFTPIDLNIAILGERVPTLTSFPYTDNASGSVMTTTYNGVRGLSLIRTDGGTSGERISLLGKAIPAGTGWSATCKFDFAQISGASVIYACGMMLYNSSSHKYIQWGPQILTGALRLTATYWSNLTTFSSDILNGGWKAPLPMWLQIVESSTLYTFKYSFDAGQTWTTWTTALKATYFTADKVGFGMSTSSGISFNPVMLVHHYDDPDITL